MLGRGGTLGRHLLLLACYMAAGIAVTWPRVTYLAGRLPATRDAGGYVWDFWWVARQVSHLASPWSTSYIAAPVGTDLGYHTLMPLPGLLLTPVTLTFGPSASYNLLSIACPGLLCYAMYRAARLWLPSQAGAIAAGALFGLSSILAWRSWYEVNLAAGALFLPMALEASVRLRRRPGPRQAIILGLVMGAAVLTDQESAVLAAIVTALVLLPWMLRHPTPARLWPPALATAIGTAIATPQIIAMTQQALADRMSSSQTRSLAVDYVKSGAGPGQLFAPSPRVADFGMKSLGSFYYSGQFYYNGQASMVVTTFGVVLTVLALFGLAVAWRQRSARLLGLLWAGCAALALGSAVWIGRHSYTPLGEVSHGARISALLPFTWFVKVPGLSSFREADRFTLLGLIPAALLAGAAVNWLRYHARPLLIPVLALALLEAGWSGNPGIATMPTAMPALDTPIAADHSNSVVVDIPFGIRGGLPVIGSGFPPQSMVLATADHHPLADAFISRIPATTLSGIEHHPFYATLLNAEGGGGGDHAGRVQGSTGRRPPHAHRLGTPLAPEARCPALPPPDRFPVRLPGRRCLRLLASRALGAVLRSARRGRDVAEEPFSGQSPDQATESSRETGPLLRGQGSDDAGLPGLPGPPDLGRDQPALWSEVQPDIPLVLLVAAAPDPAFTFQAGREAAHRALLKAEQVG